MAGNNYLVIKSMPALIISEAQITAYATALENVCEMVIHEKTKFWAQGIQMAAKAFSKKAILWIAAAPLNQAG